MLSEAHRPKGGASQKPNNTMASASPWAAIHPHAKQEAFWQI